jgi:hypothetical protein
MTLDRCDDTASRPSTGSSPRPTELVLDGESYHVRQRPVVADPVDPRSPTRRHHDADVNPETRPLSLALG